MFGKNQTKNKFLQIEMGLNLINCKITFLTPGVPIPSPASYFFKHLFRI